MSNNELFIWLYTYQIITIILAFCLFSPNLVYLIHKSHFIWRTKMEKLDPNYLKGLTKDHAGELAAKSGYTIRIMKEDGVSYYGTANLDLKRINLYLEKGLVVNYHVG